jgi:hypothetical protein
MIAMGWKTLSLAAVLIGPHVDVASAAGLLPRGPSPTIILAQGSTGGTLGKQDNSISGGVQPSKESSDRGRKQPPPSVSGRWQWTQSCSFGSYRGTFELRQPSPGSLQGTVYQQSPEASGPIVEGRASGSSFSFKVTLSHGVETFSGSVGGPGRLQGTSHSQYGPCTWTAHRD